MYYLINKYDYIYNSSNLVNEQYNITVLQYYYSERNKYYSIIIECTTI